MSSDQKKRTPIAKRRPGPPGSYSREFLERRNNDVLAQRTELICTMYLEGRTLHDIGREVALSHEQVRRIINEARVIWLEKHDRALNDLVAEQLAKIDQVEANAWDCFRRSQKIAEETQESSGSNKNGPYASSKVTKKKQVGGAEWLNLILTCVKQRNELLGLNKQREDDSARPNSMLVVVNTPQEARAIAEYTEFSKLVDGYDQSQSSIVDGVSVEIVNERKEDEQ